jgi:hypothetical protein
VQLVEVELPAGEVELDGQVIHVELAEAPTAVEYVPTPQSVQTAEGDGMLQEATNPDRPKLPSDVNTTCMYPVLDV